MGFVTLSCQGSDSFIPPEPLDAEQALAAPRADAVEGFADLHNHVFGEYAYQGAWYHGSTLGPEGGDDTYPGMSACDGNRPGGPQDHAMTIDGLLCKVGGFATEDVCGHVDRRYGFSENEGRQPSYSGWPRAHTIAHQQNWWGHLHDAWEDGLRLMVVPGVNFRILCQLMEPENYRFDYDCEDLGAVDLQLEAAWDFVALHNDWVEIATSPEEARRIIGDGKLAMILAIEVTDIFPTGAMDSAPMTVDGEGNITSRGGVFTQLQRYYDLGVRSIQIAHEYDSRFAGVAVYSQIFELLYTIADYQQAHPERLSHIELPGDERSRYGFDLDANGYNRVGLSAEGRQLVEAMMELGMPIDIAHLSHKSAQSIFDLAKARDYYPLFHSHAKLKQILGPPVGKDLEKHTPEWLVDELRATGGMIGLRTHSEGANTYPDSGIENNCDGSSRSFAQTYTYADQELNIPLGFAVDMNGFATQMTGRLASDACSKAPDAQTQAAQAAAQTDDGTGTLYDKNGLGHIGLLGRGLLADMRNLGVDTTNLDTSAEAYIKMWERATGQRDGPVGPPPVSDRSQLTKGSSDASGLKLAAIIPGSAAQARSYTVSVVGSGATRTAQLITGNEVVAEVAFSAASTVTADQWRTLTFGDHVAFKLSAEGPDPVPLSTLQGAFFDGQKRLTLAYP